MHKDNITSDSEKKGLLAKLSVARCNRKQRNDPTAVWIIAGTKIKLLGHYYKRIFVYIFCLVKKVYAHSSSNKANNIINLWILKEHENFSYFWKSEPNLPNGFGEILF